jgi:hypothetical protein
MNAYDLCSNCARHIKTHESRCPFCGATHTRKRHAARQLLSRMSRAQWLAFGSTLAVVGCGDKPGTPLASVDASDGSIDAPARPCPCDLATQFCRGGTSNSCGPPGCFALPSDCVASPTCGCLANHIGGNCAINDAGAIEVTCSCYGSPPARLERPLRARLTTDVAASSTSAAVWARHLAPRASALT